MKALFLFLVVLSTVGCNIAPSGTSAAADAKGSMLSGQDTRVFSVPAKSGKAGENCWYLSKSIPTETRGINEILKDSQHKFVENKQSFKGVLQANQTGLLSGGPVKNLVLEQRLKSFAAKRSADATSIAKAVVTESAMNPNIHSVEHSVALEAAQINVVKEALIDIANGVREDDYQAKRDSKDLAYNSCPEPSESMSPTPE